MKQLLILDIGQRLVLAEDWTFELYGESRNATFLKFLDVKEFTNYYTQRNEHWTVTLKAGTVLGVDRVYIRRTAKDFSSVTFNYVGVKGKGRLRFWAKLADVNNIRFTEPT